MLLRWPPHYEKLVLEHGDDSAIHVGGKGGLGVTSAAVSASGPSQPSDVPSGERRWLRDNGIDWDGTPA